MSKPASSLLFRAEDAVEHTQISIEVMDPPMDR